MRSQKLWGGVIGQRSCGVGLARSQQGGEVTEDAGWDERGQKSCRVGRARSQKL